MIMEQSLSVPALRHAMGPVQTLLAQRAVQRALYVPSALSLDDGRNAKADSPEKWRVDEWRRWTHRVLSSHVAVTPNREPAPPAEWTPILTHLVELAHAPVAPPSWWTPATAFCGNIETHVVPSRHLLDSSTPPWPDDTPVLYFQLTIAGWGQLQRDGVPSRKVTPGTAVFSTNPSRDRCSLPPESPGWTVAWIGIQHPYLTARVASQVAATGPILDIEPDEALTASALRLFRGAIKKDFCDRFEAELAMLEFVVRFERRAHETQAGASAGQRLIDDVRARIVARLPEATAVNALAAEFGMSRSHFSAWFRQRTGLTPAHFSTEVRIQKAERMLLETRAPLKVVADACGFASANHFCRVFRRVRYLSPAAFREVRR
jgi:AraC-like DNA-binding protein